MIQLDNVRWPLFSVRIRFTPTQLALAMYQYERYGLLESSLTIIQWRLS